MFCARKPFHVGSVDFRSGSQLQRLDELTNTMGAMKRDKALECEMSFAYEVTIAGRRSHWPVLGRRNTDVGLLRSINLP